MTSTISVPGKTRKFVKKKAGERDMSQMEILDEALREKYGNEFKEFKGE